MIGYLFVLHVGLDFADVGWVVPSKGVGIGVPEVRVGASQKGLSQCFSEDFVGAFNDVGGVADYGSGDVLGGLGGPVGRPCFGSGHCLFAWDSEDEDSYVSEVDGSVFAYVEVNGGGACPHPGCFLGDPSGCPCAVSVYVAVVGYRLPE